MPIKKLFEDLEKEIHKTKPEDKSVTLDDLDEDLQREAARLFIDARSKVKGLDGYQIPDELKAAMCIMVHQATVDAVKVTLLGITKKLCKK